MGTICAITGCDVNASARPTIATSRTLRVAAFSRPFTVALRGVATLSIETYSSFKLGIGETEPDSSALWPALTRFRG